MAKSKQVLALAALQVAKRRPVSPLQSRQNQNMAACSQAWGQLDPQTRANWQNLANQMKHQTGLRTPSGLKQKRPMNAFQCFASINGTLLACGQPLSVSAPDAVARPAALPPLMLQATSSIPGQDTAPGVLHFGLTLTAPAYREMLQIYAAPPQLAGQHPTTGLNTAIIAVLPSLASGPTDLAPAYFAKYGLLYPGQQVVLTLQPVSAEGFKGTPMTMTATVNAPAQAPAQAPAKHSGSDTLTLKSA